MSVEDGRVKRVPERRCGALLKGREQLLVLGEAVLVGDVDIVFGIVVLAQEVTQRLARRRMLERVDEPRLLLVGLEGLAQRKDLGAARLADDLNARRGQQRLLEVLLVLDLAYIQIAPLELLAQLGLAQLGQSRCFFRAVCQRRAELDDLLVRVEDGAALQEFGGVGSGYRVAA